MRLRSPALALLLVAGTAAQQPPLDTATRLHTAWLREVLDLDVDGAVQEYQRIAADARPANLERWIAVARLAELQRAGIPVAMALPIAEAPLTIRNALQPLRPLQVTAILKQLTQEPAAVMLSLATEAGKLPELRPATGTAQTWVRNQQGPSATERANQRRRAQMLANSRQRPPDAERMVAERNAFDVLVSELQGRQGQAQVLRDLYFGVDWKAQQPRGEPAELLARVRTNLEAWLAQPNLPNTHQYRLRNLRDHIKQRADADPNGLLTMVARLPLVGEKLLAEPPPSK
ncbi:MAG: hypothetical protein WAT39_00250 [Planctomycetota bacterium]